MQLKKNADYTFHILMNCFADILSIEQSCLLFYFLFISQKATIHLASFAWKVSLCVLITWDHKVDCCISRNSMATSFKFFRAVVTEVEHQIGMYAKQTSHSFS